MTITLCASLKSAVGRPKLDRYRLRLGHQHLRIWIGEREADAKERGFCTRFQPRHAEKFETSLPIAPIQLRMPFATPPGCTGVSEAK